MCFSPVALEPRQALARRAGCCQRSGWNEDLEGRVIHFDGVEWTETVVGSQPLHDVWGRGQDVFAVGIGGNIVHFDGATWTMMDSGSTEGLYGVWGSSPHDVWAVGSSGTILHYDGGRWSSMSSPVSVTLRDVWGAGPGEIYAVGFSGTIICCDGLSAFTIVVGLACRGLARRLLCVCGVCGVMACIGERPDRDAVVPRDGAAFDSPYPTDAGPKAEAAPPAEAGSKPDGPLPADTGVKPDSPAGPCSSSLSNVSQPLCDGIYSQNIGSGTFPTGAVVTAANPGKVRFTGSFNVGSAGNLTFRGIVFASATQKHLGANNLYEDVSFVGGPSCGNTVNTTVGSNTTIRRAAFYGPGGRYLLLAYQVTGVTLEDIIFRRDGGWGAGGSGCTVYEPTAGLNLYDSSSSGGKGLVVFDAINQAHSSAEDLGELTVNCHGTCTGNWFHDSLVKGALSGAYKYEGNGAVNSAAIVNSVAKGGPYGLTRNVAGKTTATNVTLQGSISACAVWGGAVDLVNSSLQGINSCGGNGNGAGASLQLNTSFLDNPRWRQELCTAQGVTRGWCGTSLPLSTYLTQ